LPELSFTLAFHRILPEGQTTAMVQYLIRGSVVRLFGLIVRLGVRRLPFFDRPFLALYGAYKRYFEAGPVDRLREFAPPASVVIDVGANVGFFSLRFAEWVGSAGEVISIEPEPRNYDMLNASLQRAGLSGRVRALKAAAVAVTGTTLLEINPLHPADHKISRDGTGLPVDGVVLDDLVLDKQHLRPGLIKIDVQGAEMLVLLGAQNLLRMAGPALFIELHEEGLRKFGTSVAAILDHLSGHGYAAYWLMRKGPHRKASPAEIHARVARTGYVDVLFLRAS
jgi:FkbM family methyltransferase